MEVIEVHVNAPDGRSVSLEVSNQSPVAHVLKKACGKLNLNEEDYHLSYDEKVLPLDKVLSDFDGLRNGVCLSLLTLPPSEESQSGGVRVVLLNQGTSRSHLFQATASLWDVYNKLVDCPNPNMKEIQISYLGHNFIGKNLLQGTKLSSLGRNCHKIILVLNEKWKTFEETKDSKEKNVCCKQSKISKNKLKNERTNNSEKIVYKNSEGNKTKNSAEANDIAFVPSVEQMKTATGKAWLIPPKLSKILNMRNQIVSIKAGKNVKNIKEAKVESENEGKTEELEERKNPKEMKVITPRRASRLSGITSVDKNYYITTNERSKGIINLDERKGLSYSLRQRGSFGRTELALLGLNKDDTLSSATAQDENGEIPLKIVFPQQYVVQASFKCDETVSDVHDFISQLTKSSDYVLCSSDTKCDLDRDTYIKDLVCSPEGNLFVRFTSDSWRLQPQPLYSTYNQPQIPKENQPPKKKIWKMK